MEFAMYLLLFTNWKRDSYDLILVTVNRLTKMVHYKLVKVTINAPRLAKVIIDVVVQHFGLPNSIISDRRAIFMSKFRFSLCYFLGIKQRLYIAFHPQTNGQTKW